MAHSLNGIDHVILTSDNPDEAAAVWRRLGFAVVEGRTAAGAPQQLVLLPGAHLSLSADGARDAVGLACRDLGKARASLTEAGFAPGPVASGAEAAGTVPLPVKTAWLPADSLPGPLYLLCERPDDPRGEDAAAHPNGVGGIVSLTVVVEEPESLMTDFNRLFGPAASTPTDDMVTVHTGRGLIYLVSPERFDDLHPSLDLPEGAVPALKVVTFGVADLTRTEQALAGQGVHVARRSAHLSVQLPALPGLAVEFIEA